MTLRIKTTAKYDPLTSSMVAVDPASGKFLTIYGELSYGDTPAARAGTADDPAEAVKTFATKLLRPVTDLALDMDAQPVVWVTVPTDKNGAPIILTR